MKGAPESVRAKRAELTGDEGNIGRKGSWVIHGVFPVILVSSGGFYESCRCR